MTTMFLTHGRRISYTLALSDVVLMSLVLLVAMAATSGGGDGARGFASAHFFAVAGFVPIQLAALYALGLFAPTMNFQSVGHGLRLALALGLGLMGLELIEQLWGLTFEPVPLMVASAVLFCLLFAVHYVVLGWALHRTPQRRLAVVGELPAILELVGRIRAEPFAGYSIVRICVPPLQKPDSDQLDLGGRRVEVTDEVGKLLGSTDFDAVAFDPHCNNFNERDLCQLAELSGAGVAIYDLAALSKRLAGRVPRSSLDATRMAEAICTRNASDRVYRALKRGFDVAFASCALALGFVPMLLVALLIKLDSPGPVLLVQRRVGYRGRIFRCFKFRTMTETAERDGPAWTAEADPRITRVGRFLRKTRFDELPQLLNVLRGDMSVVGPRPVLAKIADSVKAEMPLYHVRHTVRPGITGWAQVKQGYAHGKESELAKLRYDLYYIERRSLLLDVLILLMTAGIVVSGAGR